MLDYKFLRGNALNNDTNFVRVNTNLVVARAANFKTASWVELGSTAVRFARRAQTFNRSFYGSVKPR